MDSLDQSLQDLDTLIQSLIPDPDTLAEVKRNSELLIAIFGSQQKIHGALAEMNARAVSMADQNLAALQRMRENDTLDYTPDYDPGF